MNAQETVNCRQITFGEEMMPYVLIYIMHYGLKQPEAHLASKKLVELCRTEFERRFRERYSSSPQIGSFNNGEPDDPYFTIDNDGYRPGTGFDSLNAKGGWRETADKGLRLLWEVAGYILGALPNPDLLAKIHSGPLT